MTSLFHAIPLLLFSCALLWVGFSVFLQNRDAAVNRLFFTAATIIALHSLFEFLFRIAPTPEQAWVWYRLGFFQPLLLALVMHFVLLYTGKWDQSDKYGTACLIYGPALCFTGVNVFSNILRGTPVRSPAGWIYQISEPGIIPFVYTGWVVLIAMILLIVLWKHFFESITGYRKTNLLFAIIFTMVAVCMIFVIVVRRFFIPHHPDLTGPAAALVCGILGGLVWELKQLLTSADASEDILAIMPESLFLLNPDSIILQINRSAQKLCGYHENELVGQNLSILFSEDVVKRICFSGQDTEDPPQPVLEDFHTAIKTKPGEKKPVSLIAARIRDKKGEPIGSVLVITDLSHIRKTEEQLLKTNRLESLETVMRGVAHDLNNLLTTISANLSLAGNAENNSQKNSYISCAESAVFMGAELATQLLSFSGKNMPGKEICSITRLLEEAVALSLRGTNIRSEMSVPEKDGAVKVDRCQMLQVLMNLLINARQSMPRGGTIRISAKRQHYSVTGSGDSTSSGILEIRIVDEGTGVAKDVLEHIFEPFYTTKEKGSGLGLAIAKSIVNKHSGSIEIDSKQGIGTTATIILPEYREPAACVTEKPVHGTSTGFTRYNGRLLVMDDNDMFRQAMGQMLQSKGFEVTQVSNGGEAIALYLSLRAQNCPFHGVILDLTVEKGPGGLDTIKRLKEIDPGVKAIISSGYRDDDVMLQFQKYGFVGAIPKPFTLSDLDRVIGTVFREEPTRK